jgi:glycosyltransferase involved in cell wall biosynthesis
MNNPFFTVVIPTYNQAQLLKTCLNSVFKQTFNNYEIIVIDNYSNDNTSDIVRKNNKKIVY